ncbi:hypothetical protein [Fusobacterium periodonticum]|uniref:hypothetical protein n=1 Tax=Fusobacterium periodonticum TaxID=860 RepID=UPI0028D182AB|nr:hypothetical protein [Fusobacterium periodonticum]
MKKILILMVMVLGLVACGEKFPYTSQSTKEKMIKEVKVAMEKAEETKSEKDVQVLLEKMGEIIKISTELEKRISEGDEKAKEELDKWDKMITEIKPQ